MSAIDESISHRGHRTSLIGRLRAIALTTGLTIVAALAFIASPSVNGSDAQAKTPGKTYCYNRICHRVLTLAETRRLVGRRTSVVASYYSHCRVDRFNPCGLTSSGAKFQPSRADNAASPIYPNGTKILVWNPANRRAAVIRIDNAGPYWRNRKLDLSSAAASKLGFRKRGVARLMVQVLKAPTRRQARYRRHRTYPRVAGYIGRFTSMAGALKSTGTPVRARTQRVAAANVVLPVRNTYLAERRIWLARMAEPRPVTVATAAAPGIRLPARLIRTTLAPSRTARRQRSGRKLAALSIRQQRSKSKKPRKTIRLRAKTAKSKTAAKRKKTAALTPIKRNKTNKPLGASKAAKKAVNKSVVKPAAAPSNKVEPVAAAAPAKPKPDLRWRQRLLGVNRGGA